MSHIIKVLLRIILNRWKSKIISKVAEVQYRLVKDKEAANAIFIIKT